MSRPPESLAARQDQRFLLVFLSLLARTKKKAWSPELWPENIEPHAYRDIAELLWLTFRPGVPKGQAPILRTPGYKVQSPLNFVRLSHVPTPLLLLRRGQFYFATNLFGTTRLTARNHLHCGSAVRK